MPPNRSAIIRRLLEIEWADRWLLAEAVVSLAAARLSVLFVPFQRIAGRLGPPRSESVATLPDERARRRALGVGWAVRAAAARVPWNSACLVQGLAAQRMLRRRRLPGTLYLGVARDVEGRRELDAHAWLRSGELILTGAAGRERYSIIASFCWE